MKRILWSIALAAIFTGKAYADFTDEFNSPVLDPGWRIINEDTNYWSLTDRPGYLRIETQFFTSVPVNFFAHVEVITGNFSVTSKLICHPDSAGQVAMVYADYDTMGQMPWAIVGFGNYLGYSTVVIAMLGDSISGAFYLDTLVYLRIRTYEDTVFGEYSPDSQNWTIIRSAWNPLFIEHQWSGVMAINQADLGATPQTPAMNADYDWFHLVALTGVEERPANGRVTSAAILTVVPSPFISYTRIPGHERESFVVYDAQGRKVGIYPGDRVCDGLAPGVYFVLRENHPVPTIRIVKIR
jgi:hypothetical protein